MTFSTCKESQSFVVSVLFGASSTEFERGQRHQVINFMRNGAQADEHSGEIRITT